MGRRIWILAFDGVIHTCKENPISDAVSQYGAQIPLVIFGHTISTIMPAPALAVSPCYGTLADDSLKGLAPVITYPTRSWKKGRLLWANGEVEPIQG